MVGKVAALTDFERFQSRITKICPYGVFFFNFPLSPESSKYENDEGGGQLKTPCMDAVLSHVIMRITWGGLLV